MPKKIQKKKKNKTEPQVQETRPKDFLDLIAPAAVKFNTDHYMMMNILAAGMELTDEDLRELRGRCVREVKETRGRISFEDAWEYQKGGRETP